MVFRYYSADALQQCENLTNPAKCLTAIDTDTGVVAGRYVQCTRGVYLASEEKTQEGVPETQSHLISRFIGQNHMVVGQDSGALVLVNLTKERDGDKLTHYLEAQVWNYCFW